VFAERAGPASTYGRDDVPDAFLCVWSALRIEAGAQVSLPETGDADQGLLPRICF
jgi:hypothetical protein